MFFILQQCILMDFRYHQRFFFLYDRQDFFDVEKGDFMKTLKELAFEINNNMQTSIFTGAIRNNTQLTNLFNPLIEKGELPVDSYMNIYHGKRILFKDIEERSDRLLSSGILLDVSAMLSSNIYKYTELIRSMTTDYDPIENYNRIEELVENFTKDVDGHLISGIKKSNTINKVTPNTSNDLVNESGTEYTQDSFTDSSGQNESGTTNTSGRVHGNIGVTTTQQMLQSTREIAMFNLTKIIATDVVNMLCVGVYAYD